MFNCLFCVLEDLFLLLLSSGAVISQTQPNPLPPVSIPQHGVESREGMGKPPDPVRPAAAAAVTAAAAQQPQQQQQQQWGPSPRAMHAFDLYRACLAAGQQARFTVQQQPGGE